MTPTANDIMTPEQAAAYLQVNRETVYRYIRDGRLGASRLGRGYRIQRRSIDLLLASTFSRDDIHLRDFSEQQVSEFMEADQLTGDAARIAQRLLDHSS